MDNELMQLSENLGQLLKAKNLKLALAESCTGGGLCQIITEIAGSSAWFERGFITYSNQSKMQMLHVNAETLARFGAVSEQTALEMVQGALANSEADCAIAVTGIAGPEGGSVEKPVGTVFIAVQTPASLVCYERHFCGSRQQVRLATIKFALLTLFSAVESLG
jgi:nicotinamide-nucleotide amidase